MCSLFGFALWSLCFMGWVKNHFKLGCKCLEDLWNAFNLRHSCCHTMKHHERNVKVRHLWNGKRFARRSVSLTMWNGGHPRTTAIGGLKLASCGECLWYPHQRDKNGRSFWAVCCRSIFDNYGTNAVGRRKACFLGYFRQNGKTWTARKHWLVDLYIYYPAT